MADQKVIISVLADVANFSRGMKGLGDKFVDFSKRAALATAVVAAGLAKIAWDSIKAASDLEQAVGGVSSVFGEQAAQIDKFSKAAAQNMGLSMEQYNRIATLTGTLLKAAGTPMKELAGQTDVLLTRAGDLAATFGGTVEDAATAMNAALRGEFEPIRQFGISLSQAQIQEKALTMTHKKSASQLTARDKILATQALLMEQSADAAGQFSRESDTLAGAQARLDANVKNLSATIGGPLLENVSAAAGMLNDWLQDPATQKGFETLQGIVQTFVDSFVKSFTTSGMADVVKSVTDRVQEFVAYLSSDEGKKDIQAFADFVAGAFTVLVQIVNGLYDALKAVFGMMKQMSEWFKTDAGQAWVKYMSGGANTNFNLPKVGKDSPFYIGPSSLPAAPTTKPTTATVVNVTGMTPNATVGRTVMEAILTAQRLGVRTA